MAFPARVRPTPVGRTDWTAEKARALPDDGNRYEVLDGELFVTPAPSADHQETLRALCPNRAVRPRASDQAHLLVTGPPWGFSSRRLVQPDLMVALVKHAIEAKSPQEPDVCPNE